MTPPNPPHHSPSWLLGWGYQEGWCGSHKGEKKQVDFKIHFRWFKAFLDHVLCYFFSIKGLAGWIRTLNGKFHYFFFLKPSLRCIMIYLDNHSFAHSACPHTHNYQPVCSSQTNRQILSRNLISLRECPDNLIMTRLGLQCQTSVRLKV